MDAPQTQQPAGGLGLVLTKESKDDIGITIVEDGAPIGVTKLPVNTLLQAQMALMNGNTITIQVPGVVRDLNS